MAASGMREDPILSALIRLEAGQAAIHAELNDLRTDQTTMRGDMTTMRGEMTTMRGDMTNMREEMTGLRVELMGRMDRLQNTLTAVQDDIAVNMGAADAAQRVNENTREDMRGLREQVSVMWRQLKAVEARVREIAGDA